MHRWVAWRRFRWPRGGHPLAGVLGAALALWVTAQSPSAAAYCRTTPTCDLCIDDPEPNCPDAGPPLRWARSCVSFSVQKDGASIADYPTIEALETTAMATWENADCPGGGHPSIHLDDAFGPAVCHRHEYNVGQGNANIIMLYDRDWPYPDDGNLILAVTTVTFDAETGEIYDADMEIDASDPVSKPFSIGAIRAGFYDLESIMTHESGHFLGLSHSLAPDAVMYYQESSGTNARTLTNNDIEGICAIYPPSASTGVCDFTPRHGFSPDCAMATSYTAGCALAQLASKRGDGRVTKRFAEVEALALLGALVFRRRRSKAARSRRPRRMLQSATRAARRSCVRQNVKRGPT